MPTLVPPPEGHGPGDSVNQEPMQLQALLAGQCRIEDQLAGLASGQTALAAALAAVQRDLGALCAGLGPVPGPGDDEGQQPLPKEPQQLQPQPQQLQELQQPRPRRQQEALTAPAGAQDGVPAHCSLPLQRHVSWRSVLSGAEADEVESNMSDMAQAFGLPRSWPCDIAMREGICSLEEDDLGNVVDHEAVARLTSKSTMSLEQASVLGPAGGRFMLEPSGLLRICHDLCSLLILGYDMTAIPYILAWEVPFEGFVSYATYTTVAFWTLDIALNFRTGFYSHGELEMRPARVARRYLRTFFLPDALCVLADSVSAAVSSPGSSTDSIKLLRLAKVSRLVRIVGLLRMARLFEAIMRLADRHALQMQSTTFALETLGILLAILWLNHVLCCCWYGLARLGPSDTGVSWLDMVMSADEQRTYGSSGHAYQYLTALHWSVSQMTPGSMQVNPVNSLERAFNIACLIFGMLFFGTLVSSLSAKMMHVKMQLQGQNGKLQTLRRFLRSAAVPTQLAVSVHKQAVERLRRSRLPLTVHEVPAMDVLSLKLRMELQLEICRPHLEGHPFFRLVLQVDSFVVRRLCRDAVRFHVLSSGDTLFLPGTLAPGAYVLTSGALRYCQEPTTSHVLVDRESSVAAGQWLCEVALWCCWRHVGTAEAQAVCQLLALDAEKLLRALQGRAVVRWLVREYARGFHRRLVAATPPSAAWPDDLAVPFTTFDDIVTLLPSGVQVFVGLEALASLDSMPLSWNPGSSLAWRPSGWTARQLRAQVLDGKCVLIVSGSGEVQRVVGVVAVHLTSPDGGRILVQLGKRRERRTTPACTLPGCKIATGETAADTFSGLLGSQLAPLADSIDFDHVEVSVEWRRSRSLPVKTKYTRTVHFAKLRADFDVPAVAAPPPMLQPGSARPSGSSSAMACQVFALVDNGGCEHLVAWLTPKEFEHLSSPAGEGVLSQLLARTERENEHLQVPLVLV